MSGTWTSSLVMLLSTVDGCVVLIQFHFCFPSLFLIASLSIVFRRQHGGNAGVCNTIISAKQLARCLRLALIFS